VLKWQDRLVSVRDPAHGRRHTSQWPNPTKDAFEAAAALTALLLIPLLVLCGRLSERRRERRSRAGAELGGLAEARAQT
jgi:hypothetical protein